MKSASLIALLATAGQVLSKPLGQGLQQMGEAVLHKLDDTIDFRLAKRALSSPVVRTTNMAPNPTVPPTTTVSASRSTTTTRPTTTTTRTTTTTTTRTTTTTTTTTRTSTTTVTRSTTTVAPHATQTIDVTGLTYTNAMLQAHNVHRANHSEANLVWDTRLANIAAEIAASCNYAHNTTAGGGGYGQNIGAGSKGNAAAGLINNLMYNGEINNYPGPYGSDNIDTNGFSGWGHYSQLVWSDTTNVGCYTQYCPLGLRGVGAGVQPYFTVCNYSPPGNYIGSWSKVKAPQGGNTVVIIGS